MAIEFQPVTLDSGDYDKDAVLVFRDGRLMAVLTCLSDIHDDLEGKWFVEATFTGIPQVQSPTFAELAEVERWASEPVSRAIG